MVIASKCSKQAVSASTAGGEITSHGTCKSSSTCQKCKGRHHTLVCKTKLGPLLPAHLPKETKLNPNAPTFPTNSNLCLDDAQTFLLQIALPVVYNLDGGSQKSYISVRVGSLLNLSAMEKCSLSIATFLDQLSVAERYVTLGVLCVLRVTHPCLLCCMWCPPFVTPGRTNGLNLCQSVSPHTRVRTCWLF